MIWFFTRGKERTCVEVRRLAEDAGYSLVITGPDGLEHVENHDNPKKLISRALTAQRRLIDHGWNPVSPTGAKTPLYHPGAEGHRLRIRAAERAVNGLRRTITRIAATFGF